MQIDGGSIYAVVGDHLGAPLELLNRRGQVVWSVARSAWGEVEEEHTTDGGPRSPFRLLGRYFDEDTELCCARNR